MSDEQATLIKAETAMNLAKRNADAVIEYSKATRLELRAVQDEVAWLRGEVLTLRRLNETQTAQIGFLRAQVLGGGRTVPDATDG